MTSLLAWLAADAYAGDLGSSTVLVSRLASESSAVAPDAERLRRAFQAAIAQTHGVVEIASIADFDGQSAATYLASCPPGQHYGCAFVVGTHADVGWVVAGAVAEGEDGLSVDVGFIDLRESKVLVSIEATVDPDGESALVDDVVRLLDQVMNAGEAQDVRGDLEDPAVAWERRRAAAEAAAQELGNAADYASLVRQTSSAALEAPRLTEEDLAAYDERDDAAPWEIYGLSRREYLRFENADVTLEAWRRRASGRAGRVLVGLYGSVGGGPYVESYDGRWALDDETLAVLEVDAWREVLAGFMAMGGVDLAVGVHRYVEVAAHAALVAAPYQYRFHQEVLGEEEPLREPEEHMESTLELGGRVGVVPMPGSLVRPTGALGVSWWRGTAVDQVVELPTQLPVLAAPNLVVLQVSPGVEATVSEPLLVFGRLTAALPVAGDRLLREQEGSAALSTPGEPVGGLELGVHVTAGVTLRLGPFGSDAPRSFDE
jgi:hypothetical protein